MGDRRFELHSEHDGEPDGWDWWWLFHDDYRRPCGSSVEGTSAEWIAIAKAIRTRTRVSFTRCAVTTVDPTLEGVEGKRAAPRDSGGFFHLWSPRNSASERDMAVLSQREGDALAAWIEEHVKVPPPVAEPGAGREESTTSSASTDPAPGEPPPHVQREDAFEAELQRLSAIIERGQRQVEMLQGELARCREIILHQTRAGLGRFVLGEIDVKAGRFILLVSDDDSAETIAQGVVAHLIPLLRVQGLKVADDAKTFVIPNEDEG